MNEQVATAFWQLDQNEVLWAEGFHDRDSIRKHGKTLEKFVEKAEG